MALQDASKLKLIAPQLLPLLVDRLGDVKDRYRELAMNSLVEFWKASPIDVEKTIKEVGFGNKSWRIREQVCISLIVGVDCLVDEMVGKCSSNST
jgi:CLIP-associating protein 1/2